MAAKIMSCDMNFAYNYYNAANYPRLPTCPFLQRNEADVPVMVDFIEAIEEVTRGRCVAVAMWRFFRGHEDSLVGFFMTMQPTKLGLLERFGDFNKMVRLECIWIIR